ncbi:MAG: ribonuclease [Phycisphaera sp.]|nr:ribonuclease [Phycisphaera sp.]
MPPRGVSSANPTVLPPRVGPAKIVPGSLPAEEEAALLRTLQHIDAGTVPSGPTARRWRIPFENWAGDLPGGSYASSPYTEYRVAPPAGTAGGGVRRIVVDNQTGEVYYTWTHYGTAGNPPFVTIRGPKVP